MAAKGNYLENVYDLESPEDTRAHYDEWAESYDAELREAGYASPDRAAEALVRVSADRTAPLMDLGCGTGLSGQAFARHGFATLDGSDVSAQMLEVARRKGVYRTLIGSDITNPLPFEPGAYPVIAAVGVLTPGHGPAEVIDQVLARLPAAGLFVFSLGDPALAVPGYRARINDTLDCGVARLLFREAGPQLPGIGLGSTIHVLQKV